MVTDLIERLRDLENGQNSLIRLDEVYWNSRMLVLSEDIPQVSYSKEIYDNLISMLNGKQKELPTESMNSWSFKHNAREAAERRDRLLSHIKSVDWLVVPEELIDEIKTIFPDVKIAVIEDPKNIRLKKSVENNQNYPRVLIKEKKPDSETVELLYNRNIRKGAGLWLDMSYSRLSERNQFNIDNIEEDIDWMFYMGLERKNHNNPIKRAKIPVNIPERLQKGTFFPEIIPAETIEVPVNYYGMGGRQHGCIRSRNRFLERMRYEKIETMVNMCEKMWTAPLNSIEEILDRQELLSELIEDKDHLEKIDNLSVAINKMIEPYLHISNMSKLISAQILKTRWGDIIHPQEFYYDFKNIIQEFIKHYETIADIAKSTSSKSREMGVLLETVDYAVEPGGSGLHNTYLFLKKIIEPEVKEFKDIWNIFNEELKRTGATKLKELEGYHPYNDETLSHNERIASLKGYKSPKLTEMLKRFHMQNPVTKSEDLIAHLNYVGSKLAAYTTVAKTTKKMGWARPEILPEADGIIDIKDGLYPLTKTHASIVPNDTQLSLDERIEIIDGTNAGGKTIDLEKTMFIASLAMAGNYVPAEYAKISFFDRILFRIKQTGMYESGALVQELNNIKEAIEPVNSSSCLIGLDETFTSTNNEEGEALTYGLIQYISENKNARAILTSHYPTLHNISETQNVSGVKFSHFEFSQSNGKLLFSYKKKEGPNEEQDYAIPIAENEKIAPAIIAHAKNYPGVRG